MRPTASHHVGRAAFTCALDSLNRPKFQVDFGQEHPGQRQFRVACYHIFQQLGCLRVFSTSVEADRLHHGAVGSTRIFKNVVFPGLDQGRVEGCLTKNVDGRSIETCDAGFGVRFVESESSETGGSTNRRQVYESQLSGVELVVESGPQPVVRSRRLILSSPVFANENPVIDRVQGLTNEVEDVNIQHTCFGPDEKTPHVRYGGRPLRDHPVRGKATALRIDDAAIGYESVDLATGLIADVLGRVDGGSRECGWGDEGQKE